MIAVNRRVVLNAVCVALATATVPLLAQGQYPSKPIRLIVPFPAGGSTDLIARVLSVALGESLGQALVLEYRAGADGIIAAEATLQAPADGYTLLLGTGTGFSGAPVLHKSLPFDPIADFTPIARVGTFAQFLFVSGDLPIKTVAELIAYAHANPGKLNYGTATGAAILATAQLAQLAKLKMVQIPYKGDAPLLTDALAGRVHLMFASGAAVIPHVRSGKLRALATLLPNRSPLLPEVPTIVEAGVKLSITPWAGLFGPRGLPPEVVNGLNLGVGKVLARADVREQLGALAFDPQSSTPDEFRSFVKDQLGAWRSVAVEAGIQPE